MGAVTEYSCVRSVPGNGTTFLEPLNMQLWEELLQINGLTLRFMHYRKGIRANYAICLCGQKVSAGSVAVIHYFAVYLV
jgi:hypothetical protein